MTRGLCARLLCVLLTGFFFLACGTRQAVPGLFDVLDSSKTRIRFQNRLVSDPAFNLFSYMYYYNGAGLGAADFNGDGRTDLFFAANRQPCALYLNKGEMKFEDVSLLAGIPRDSSWSTGVSVVDINNDGLMDIYVCRVGNYKILKGKNSLLVCTGIDPQGIPHFEDRAAAYGLDFSGYGTQAVFFDQDLDGDLDLFLLNHSVNHEGNYAPRKYFEHTFDSLAGHRLYRNDSRTNSVGVFEARFTDVSRSSGIHTSKIGYGLGVVAGDINLDGWPDLYVGNDFHENDYLYINQRDGTFKDEGARHLMHTSQFSMGVDMADVNNDARPDLVSMDMLPYDAYMIRRSVAEDDYNIFRQKIDYGYTYQYARNNLQYNRTDSLFTELGQYAGIHATDWSWAALWMDFDLDGLKDLFVSNGIPKRMNDIDYINFVSSEDLQQKLARNSVQEKDLALLSKFPEIKIPNQFFLNRGGFRFTNMTDSLQDNPPSFSNGAVYADLDNDGDPDIVVNNINDAATIYANTSIGVSRTKSVARLSLRGSPMNRNAIGTRIFLFSGASIRSYENHSVHGFLSSMHGPMLIGLEGVKVDSAFLVWPDNRCQRINLKAGTTDSISWKPGLPVFDFNMLRKQRDGMHLLDLTKEAGIAWKHTENRYNEFDREPLIPHMVSAEGPALAVADINGDGLEDFYIGSSKTFQGGVFLQDAGGRFQALPQPGMRADSMWESVDAIWKDVNADRFPDLVIATGGNEYYGEDMHCKPLLYLNDGEGNLTRKEDAFDKVYITQSTILSADINGDAYPDLFIAGHAEPWQYGKPVRSHLLLNNGTGKFKDVTAAYAPDLVKPGMISHAAFADINRDGKEDLLVSMLWGGLDVYLRKGQKFQKHRITDRKGWWQYFTVADLNGDGFPDIVAGNLGLNSRLQASKEKPVRLYIEDFDGNGRVEQVMTYYVGDTEIPFAGKTLLEKSIPSLRKKFLYAADFAKAGVGEILGREKMRSALTLQADCFENMAFLQLDGMKFEAVSLPWEAQLSSYRASVRMEKKNDPRQALLLAGNFYPNHVEIGRMDGDFGMIIRMDAGNQLLATPLSNPLLGGEVRRMQPVRTNSGYTYLLAKNNDSLRLVKLD
jgi:hypothetical protein